MGWDFIYYHLNSISIMENSRFLIFTFDFERAERETNTKLRCSLLFASCLSCLSAPTVRLGVFSTIYPTPHLNALPLQPDHGSSTQSRAFAQVSMLLCNQLYASHGRDFLLGATILDFDEKKGRHGHVLSEI